MFTHPDSSPFVIGSEFQILPPCSMRKMNHSGREKNLVSRRAGVLEVKLGNSYRTNRPVNLARVVSQTTLKFKALSEILRNNSVASGPVARCAAQQRPHISSQSHLQSREKNHGCRKQPLHAAVNLKRSLPEGKFKPKR